jgi:hypothetical protein
MHLDAACTVDSNESLGLEAACADDGGAGETSGGAEGTVEGYSGVGYAYATYYL